jgi:pimeloyl-ACP methyl ester carboxylesterase
VAAYARKVAGQVQALLQAGVAPECITVVGFSKGGAIAVHASALLGEKDVRFVFLAPCGPYLDPTLPISGHILSIYEESDEMAGSCAALFEHAATPRQLRETRISTGRGHGAFWQPRDAWMSLVLAWIAPEGEVGCPARGAVNQH